MWEWTQMNNTFNYIGWLFGPRMDQLTAGCYNARWW